MNDTVKPLHFEKAKVQGLSEEEGFDMNFYRSKEDEIVLIVTLFPTVTKKIESLCHTKRERRLSAFSTLLSYMLFAITTEDLRENTIENLDYNLKMINELYAMFGKTQTTSYERLMEDFSETVSRYNERNEQIDAGED